MKQIACVFLALISVSFTVNARDIQYVDRSYKINFSDDFGVAWQDLSIWSKIGRTLKKAGITIYGKQKPEFRIEENDQL